VGSTPIGGPIVGWVGQDAGARWSLVTGGLPTLVCGILALPALARIDRRGTREQPPAAPDRDSPDQNGPMAVTTDEPLMLGRAGS